MEKKIEISFSSNSLNFSDLENEIKSNWNKHKLQYPSTENNPLLLFSADNITEDSSGNISIVAQKGMYDTYLYLRNNQTNSSLRSIGAVSTILTSDDYFAFGLMNGQTVISGWIVLLGGSYDLADVNGSYVDMFGGIRREIYEESGCVLPDFEVLSFRYLNNLAAATIFYHANTSLSSKQMREIMIEHNTRLIDSGEDPELKDLIFVPRDKKCLYDLASDSRSVKYISEVVDNLEKKGYL